MTQNAIIESYQQLAAEKQIFSAELVWAYAVQIDKQYGGYYKEAQYIPREDGTYEQILANKVLLRTWLLNPDNVPYISDEVIEESRQVRTACKGWLFKKLAGRSSEFVDYALLIANKEEFAGTDRQEISTIACLPNSVRHDSANDQLRKLMMESEQLIGEIGESIIMDVKIIEVKFFPEYSKLRVSAVAGNSVVYFFVKPADYYKKDATIHIKAKIKSFTSEKTTQLNYVRLA